MVTIRDVAKRAGVSTAVVSAALSGRVGTIRMAEATRIRVEQAVAETGYRANHAAQALRRSHTGIIAAVVPKIANPIFEIAINGMQEAAEDAGDVLLLADAEWAQPGTRLLSRLAGTNMVDGFLVRTVQLGDEAIDEIERYNTPCVVLQAPDDGQYVSVWVDDNLGIYTATKHLLDLGHQRIMLIGGPLHRTDLVDTRKLGFERAFLDHKIAPPMNAVLPIGYSPEDIHKAVKPILKKRDRPTGIVVDNVVAAPGVIAGAVDLGIHIPHELSIVAYHDIPQVDLMRPALTTVQMPVRQAGYHGYKALKRLIQRKSVPSRILSRPLPRLILRQSSGPAPGN